MFPRSVKDSSPNANRRYPEQTLQKQLSRRARDEEYPPHTSGVNLSCFPGAFFGNTLVRAPGRALRGFF